MPSDRAGAFASPDIITGHQVRFGCMLLGWKTSDLAKASDVPCRSVAEAQILDIGGLVTVTNLAAIRHALENAGLEFLYDEEPSVRFRKGRFQWP